MRQRLLGARTALRVSELALGCGLLGATDAGLDPQVARETLLAFAEAGGTLLDTSSAHGGGRSEEFVGRFLADEGRDRFVVSTKYGRAPGGDKRSLSGGAHPRAMLAQVEASLRQLGTDRIDLYSVEFPDGITPVEEIMRCADLLVRQGKVVAFALSNFAAWEVTRAATLAELRGWAPVAAIHYQYNLLERSAEQEQLQMAAALGLGVMAWSPQARGRLARDELQDVPPQLATELRAIAADREASVGAVALAWLLGRGVVPVVGARSPAQLAAAMRAVDLNLDVADLNRLEHPRADRPYPDALWAQMRAGIGIDAAMLAEARRKHA